MGKLQNQVPIVLWRFVQQKTATSFVLYSVVASFCSGIFFWYWIVYSDNWHLSKREIDSFPIGDLSTVNETRLREIGQKLQKDLVQNAVWREEYRNARKDRIRFQQFSARQSKQIIDEIDIVLADHFGFTAKELAYILNYDLKYRWPKSLKHK